MKVWTRRKFIYASASLPIISCSQIKPPIKITSPIKPIKSKSIIDTEIRFAKRIMNKEIPGSIELENEAKGEHGEDFVVSEESKKSDEV